MEGKADEGIDTVCELLPLYGPHKNAGWFMYKKMVKGIKKLWSDASQDMEHPMNPLSIDGFKMHYMKTPKQDNG